MKVCSKCKIEKDEGDFYKNKNAKDGLVSSCKQCIIKYLGDRIKLKQQQQNKIKNKVKNKLIQSNTKKCKICMIIKLKNEFYNAKSNIDGKNASCKSCLLEKQESLRKLGYYKKYRESEKYKEYQKNYLKKYKQGERYKKYLENTNWSYRACLGLNNTPIGQIPPELLELKKIQLQIKREIKKGVQNEKTN